MMNRHKRLKSACETAKCTLFKEVNNFRDLSINLKLELIGHTKLVSINKKKIIQPFSTETVIRMEQ